jgi:APA family basic amino acid/polyamine antiporter
MKKVALKRSIGQPLLTFYGLGTILGAGIYVLVGEIAAAAGTAAPSAFLLAAVIAAFTALSYAELSSRLPKSAGEAAYVDAAFRRPALSQVVGWAVVIVGVVSAATMCRGVIGYLSVFVETSTSLVLIMLILALGALAVWGITESLIAAALITVVEVAGLVFVIAIAADSLGNLPREWRSLLPEVTLTSLSGVMAGAFLAFYAFIGFEDIVNVAEEVKSPTRTLPAAIVWSLVIATTLYIIVTAAAVLSVPIDRLAGSDAPLAVVIESAGYSPLIIAAISLLAITNGALVQIVMASRVLYGLADQGLAWRVLARVDSRTRTPVVGTLLITVTILILALFFDLGELARLTSAIALLIFAMVNTALLKLKFRKLSDNVFEVPITVPIAGLLLSAGMLLYQALDSLRFLRS